MNSDTVVRNSPPAVDPDAIRRRITSTAIDEEIQRLERSIVSLQRILRLRGREAELQLQVAQLGPNPEHVELITVEVAATFRLPMHTLRSRDRTARIAVPRQVIFYLARVLVPGLTLHRIGAFFGRDHGTVMHGCETIAARIDTEPSFAKQVEELRQRCQERLNNGHAEAV